MIEITNKQKFDEIVSQAIEKVAMTVQGDKLAQRWINAINKAAIDRYISKPWKSNELLQTVKELLTDFIFEKGIPYEPHLQWLDKTVVFEKLRKSTS